MMPTKLETTMGFSEREPWTVDQWEMDKKIPLDAEIPGVTQLNLTDETVLQVSAQQSDFLTEFRLKTATFSSGGTACGP